MRIHWDIVFKNHPKGDDERLADYYRRLEEITGMPPEYIKKVWYQPIHRQIREVEKLKSEHPALAKEAEEVGIPLDSISHYWHKGDHFSIFSKRNQKTYFDIRDEIVQDMEQHAPDYNIVFEYPKVSDPHLLIIDPADIHIGKLALAIETGDEYNVEIAINRIMEGVKGLVSKTVGFGIDRILLLLGNDILHTDTPKRTTTSGTPQDTDGMWFSNFMTAKDVYVKVIDILLPIAPIDVHYDPSNHDYTNGFFLADTISSWFKNCKSVTFNVTPSHRKYLRYGKNLIGTTHGDGAKEPDLPLLMANEASEHWHECKHRYIYTHHIHHKKAKEYQGVTVEAVRSASGTDSWHHRNGYQHNVKAIEAFLHHSEHGQIARFTHIF